MIKNNFRNPVTTTTALIKNGYYFETDGLIFQIIVIGDITPNGKLDIRDLTRLRGYLVGYSDCVLSELELEAADVNGTGDVNVLDLTRMRRMLVE